MPARLRLPYKGKKCLTVLEPSAPEPAVGEVRSNCCGHVHAGLRLEGHPHWPIHRYPQPRFLRSPWSLQFGAVAVRLAAPPVA